MDALRPICLEDASEKTALRLRLADLCFLYNPRSYKTSCDIVRQYADHFISKALECRKRAGEEEAFARYPFIIDMYSKVEDVQRVRDQLINVLLGGRDARTCAMSSALFMRVRHPEKLAKLRAEIYTVSEGKTTFTRAHLS